MVLALVRIPLTGQFGVGVVACAILKDAHLGRYGPLAIDPYMLSLGVLVERFCPTIARGEPPGAIVVERRGEQLDHGLIVAWQSLCLNGTRYMSPGTITRRIASLETRGKCADDAGLQLADLVVSPIARAVIGHRADRQMRLHDTAGVQPTTRHGRDGESAPCGEDRDRVST